MNNILWTQCLQQFEYQMPQNQFNTWIRPLSAYSSQNAVWIAAPNAVIRDWAQNIYAQMITEQVYSVMGRKNLQIHFVVADSSSADPVHSDEQPHSGHFDETDCSEKILPHSDNPAPAPVAREFTPMPPNQSRANERRESGRGVNSVKGINLRTSNPLREYTFENFIEGYSNQLAKANALKILENIGDAQHNPLVICGGVGLGKTHLMHAIGNAMLHRCPDINVVCRSTEDFVNDMINCIKLRAMDEFHHFYRSVHLLLLDDVQFFVGKEKSQMEIFHTIEALRENGGQLVLTCDKYPSNIREIESRLRSRFAQGLTVVIEPPELETRAAILIQKAAQQSVVLPQDCALQIAENIRTNVRELEGALNRLIASARFKKQEIDRKLVKETLHELISISDRGPTIDEIKKKVADYFGIRLSSLDAAVRTRSIVRPRQMAMALSKELTRHSLSEIGASFGNRDHTTVIHACNIIKRLCNENPEIQSDHLTLMRQLRE